MNAYEFIGTILKFILNLIFILVASIVEPALRALFPNFNWDSSLGTAIFLVVIVLVILLFLFLFGVIH